MAVGENSEHIVKGVVRRDEGSVQIEVADFGRLVGGYESHEVDAAAQRTALAHDGGAGHASGLEPAPCGRHRLIRVEHYSRRSRGIARRNGVHERQREPEAMRGRLGAVAQLR